MTLDPDQTWADNDPRYPASAARISEIEHRIDQVNSAVSTTKGKLKALGSVSGVVKLNLSEGSVFTLTLTGNAELELVSPPTEPQEVVIFVTQDSVGGHTWLVKSIVWVGSTPSFPLTKELTEVVSVLSINTGAELYGLGGLEATLGSETVTTESLKAKLITKAKMAFESVSGGTEAGNSILTKEAVQTFNLGALSVTRAKMVAELSQGSALGRGRAEATAATELVINIAKPIIFTTNCIQLTLEGTGTPVAYELSARDAGKEKLTVKFASAFTGFVNWVVYE
jgi:hypothetical protein